MYKLNFLDAKRNPNALLQPLKPVSESALQGRDSKAVEAANGEEDEKGPTYPYNAWPKIYHNAREPGISASTQNDASILSEKQRCQSPDRSSSPASMDNNGRNLTPPESPLPGDSPGAGATQDMSRLSLDQGRPVNLQGSTNAGLPNGNAAPSSKRSASAELQRDSSRQAPGWQKTQQHQSTQSRGANRGRRGRAKHNSWGDNNFHTYQPKKEPITDQSGRVEPKIRNQIRPPRDSGYGSLPASRQNTSQAQPDATKTEPAQPASLAPVDEHGDRSVPVEDDDMLREPSPQRKYPGLILQPESTPISKDQLAAEVKGIYAGLVMVESKCINIDSAQAADPNSQLGPEQWQALIALHRTLLYEHHDFLMATQHPSATPALRGLANKYSMPARMWKHGIHAFLEVLRHRRPESQDYMLAFIYLAYQMMALLFETVPSFVDTWIECLGDLARYRMAIEEEREAHTTWGSVAGRWYRLAADRHPATGRLNHHLGILERPSLRKLFLYSKSLTCVIPFINAKDSLATLCNPLAQNENTMQQGAQTAEARVVTSYAMIYLGYDQDTTSKIATDALIRLGSQPSTKLRDYGVEMVVTGVAFILELGTPSNGIWQSFATAINNVARASRPSGIAASPGSSMVAVPQEQSPVATTFATQLVYDFVFRTFNSIFKHRKDRQSLRNVLPSVHTVLVWLHAIITVGSRNKDAFQSDTFVSLIMPSVDWVELTEFLNKLIQTDQISARTLEFARQGMFLTPERVEDAQPLTEDLSIRGLIWTQFYHPTDWFSGPIEDEARTIETAGMHKARVERVQWLALYLTFRIDYLKYNTNTKTFYAPVSKTPSTNLVIEPHFVPEREPWRTGHPSPTSRSSTTFSANSDSSDGFAVVTSSKRRPNKAQSKAAPAPTKSRREYSSVQVVDQDSMQWEQEC